MKNISRRDFLKGAFAGIAGTALTSALSGCRLIPPFDIPGSAPNLNTQGGEGGRYADWVISGVSAAPTDTASPGLETTPAQEAAVYDSHYQLDFSLPVIGDLELPVVGATGYASISLNLWRELPVGSASTYGIPSYLDTTESGTTGTSGTTNSTSTVPQTSTGTGNWSATQYYEEHFNSAPTPQSDVAPLSAATPLSASGSSFGTTLSPGTAFIILEESGDWWLVRTEESAGNRVGWIAHRYCLINLPDVVPSMIYNNTNSYASVFRCIGKDIPGITDQPLYDARTYNPRLGKDEYLMPVLYAMAKKVCQAQQKALAEGNTLVLYEDFRPKDVQIRVAQEVNTLANQDPDVRRGISTNPWNISWFIATGISNHQQGYAMDVSLAKVTDAEVQRISGRSYVKIKGFEYYTMPTPIHELSMLAATYTAPVNILSKTAWQSAKMTDTMAANDPARALQRYCTAADMTPLASEWWHFNDLDAYNNIRGNLSKGDFFIKTCCSLPEELVAY